MANTKSIQNRESRYTQGGVTETFDGRLGWWERDIETISEDPTDMFITIAPQYDRRPDRLAFDMYGRSGLQWLVLQYNSIVDINEEFITGKEIRLPDPSRASLTFLNKRTGGKQVS